jgi:hypothetical protein
MYSQTLFTKIAYLVDDLMLISHLSRSAPHGPLFRSQRFVPALAARPVSLLLLHGTGRAFIAAVGELLGAAERLAAGRRAGWQTSWQV